MVIGKKDRVEDRDARVQGTVDLILGYYVHSASAALAAVNPPPVAPERATLAPSHAER